MTCIKAKQLRPSMLTTLSSLSLSQLTLEIFSPPIPHSQTLLVHRIPLIGARSCLQHLQGLKESPALLQEFPQDHKGEKISGQKYLDTEGQV